MLNYFLNEQCQLWTEEDFDNILLEIVAINQENQSDVLQVVL